MLPSELKWTPFTWLKWRRCQERHENPSPPSLFHSHSLGLSVSPPFSLPVSLVALLCNWPGDVTGAAGSSERNYSD